MPPFPAVMTLLASLTLPAASSPVADTPWTGLVTPAEASFLLAEIARIDPPERIRELARYDSLQHDLGGGFFGVLPEQLPHPEAVPVPRDAASIRAAAAVLARQRATNLEALRALRSPYPLSFAGGTPDLPALAPPAGLSLTLDLAVPLGFMSALADGTVTAAEADALATLPANLEMLRHRHALSYLPEPRATAATLTELIRRAGSPDPVDRIWVWLNPCNLLGYADLAGDRAGWNDFLTRLGRAAPMLTATALNRVAAFAPADVRLDATFAFTVGALIRGWVTPSMSGLDVEQVKDDWEQLLGTMTEETYHRLQLTMCPTADGGSAATFEELAAARTGDERLDRLFEVLAYTALEGSANLARGARPAVSDPDAVRAGTALLDEFVRTVVESGRTDGADALIGRGLRANGPLYAVGFAMARAIAEARGGRDVGATLQRGPVAFVLEAASTDRGRGLLTERTAAAVRDLSARIGAGSAPRP